MLLTLHIIIAVVSLVYTGHVFISPSNKKLRVVYALVVLTFVSGFSILFQKPSALAQVCFSGLAYLGLVLVGIFAAKRKLAVFIKH